MLREAGEAQPAAQILVYPGLDLNRTAASHREFARGFVLTSDDIDWYIDRYAAPDFDDFRASPLLATDHSGLAPAVITAAGFDPLRDEAEDYAVKLTTAGVPVRLLRETDLVHGYLHMDRVAPAADRAFAALSAALKEALGPR